MAYRTANPEPGVVCAECRRQSSLDALRSLGLAPVFQQRMQTCVKSFLRLPLPGTRGTGCQMAAVLLRDFAAPLGGLCSKTAGNSYCVPHRLPSIYRQPGFPVLVQLFEQQSARPVHAGAHRTDRTA